MSRRRRLVILAAAGAVALGAGLAVFQPWLLFVDVTATDALPTVAPAPSPSGTAPTADPEPEGPVALVSGVFVSHEHATTGTATIVQNPDGSRVLAIADLDTSNGPDLRVWLSAADVIEGRDGWFTAGSAAYIDLGPLKGNLGDQVYEIPADADLSTIRSVDIWCVRFSVSFGAAQLVG